MDMRIDQSGKKRICCSTGALTPEAGEEPAAQAGLSGVGLDLAAQGHRPGTPLPEIGIHLVAVALSASSQA
jgi:hypothetical protein